MTMILGSDDSEDDEIALNYTMFYRYKNRDAVLESIENCLPVSGFLTLDGRYFVCIGRNRERFYYEIDILDETGKYYGSTYYTKLQLGEQLCVDENDEIQKKINCYVLLLPYLQTDCDDNYFYIVNENWEERMCENNKFEYGLPVVSGVKY